MSSVVRQSNYRHVYGKPNKQEYCYLNIRPNVGAWDSNWIASNAKFFALPWQGGGGSVAVFKLSDFGKLPPDTPLLSGHSGPVLDLQFNPFNQQVLATSSTDSTVKIWGIGEEGVQETTSDPMVTLEGHLKKVGVMDFHPTASNVLLSAGADQKAHLWDIENGKSQIEMSGIWKDIQSVSFNKTGSQFATTSKDKKLRIIDPRSNESKVAQETDGHAGTKGSRVSWLTSLDLLFTCGFSRMSERQYMIWDPRNLNEPLKLQPIDQSAGLLMPFYDPDTNLIYLAGKGDGNIRYFELVNEEPYCHFIGNYSSTEPQKGCCMAPKIAMDTSINEITRLYKLTTDSVIPISFTVPRKSELFQPDIYPKTAAPEAPQTAADFFEGKDAEPTYVSMNPDDNEIKIDTVKLSDFKPKVEKKEKPPETELPQKTNDPKQLKKQNEELRERVEQLEKENWELKQKLGSDS